MHGNSSKSSVSVVAPTKETPVERVQGPTRCFHCTPWAKVNFSHIGCNCFFSSEQLLSLGNEMELQMRTRSSMFMNNMEETLPLRNRFPGAERNDMRSVSCRSDVSGLVGLRRSGVADREIRILAMHGQFLSQKAQVPFMLSSSKSHTLNTRSLKTPLGSYIN